MSVVTKKEAKLLELEDLPQEVQSDFKVANYYLKEKNSDLARRALRLVIGWHTDNNIEVCQKIQMAYGELLGLEIRAGKKLTTQ